MMSILDDLFVREYGKPAGKAPSLVFIHGLLGWGLNWSPVIKYFEDDYHILTYDQRGHGRSFHPQTGYAPEDYAKDLRDLLKAKDITRAHIIGHSMGARTAQCFSVSYPGQVLSLVIEDMGPSPESQVSHSTEAMIANVPVPFACKKDMDHYFETDFRADQEDQQKEVMAQFLKANLKRQKDGSIEWRFSYQGIMQTLKEGLKARWAEFKCVQVPTLILRGENSGHLSPETFELMQKSLPSAQSAVIHNAGHWIHYQRPQEFSQHVLEFLRTLS